MRALYGLIVHRLCRGMARHGPKYMISLVFLWDLALYGAFFEGFLSDFKEKSAFYRPGRALYGKTRYS